MILKNFLIINYYKLYPHTGSDMPHTGSDMQESKVRQGICANVKEL
jgi:hypothetical protein